MTSEVQPHSVIITSLTIDRPDGPLLGIRMRAYPKLLQQPAQHPPKQRHHCAGFDNRKRGSPMTTKDLFLTRVAKMASTTIALQWPYEAEQDPERAIVLFAEKATVDQTVRRS